MLLLGNGGYRCTAGLFGRQICERLEVQSLTPASRLSVAACRIGAAPRVERAAPQSSVKGFFRTAGPILKWRQSSQSCLMIQAACSFCLNNNNNWVAVLTTGGQVEGKRGIIPAFAGGCHGNATRGHTESGGMETLGANRGLEPRC